MTKIVKQSSTQLPLIFFMTDSSDHISGKTGLTPTVTIAKNGGSFASPAGAVSQMANGFYKVAANATDTDTLGSIELHATAAGADPYDGTVAMVVAFDLQDAAGLGLSRIDAAISSRSTYAGGDTSGVTTLLGRIASAITITGGKVDVNDKTGFSLSAAGVQAIWDALTSALTTVGSIGKRLADNVDATISSRSTYAGGDTSGVTTLLGRIASAITITGGKVDVNDKTGFSLSAAGVQAIWDALTSALTTANSIGKRLVDNIDATISSRLASGSYTAPDNSSIAAIKLKTDNLPPDPADASDIAVATNAIFNRLGAPAGASMSADIAAVKSDSGAIKLKTDNLPAAPAAVSDIPTANANADALLDRANGVETGRTIRQGLRAILAACVGKASGLDTNTATYRDTNDSKNRIVATVDANGNRSAVTLDLS